MSGGSITPKNRTDLGLGGAARAFRSASFATPSVVDPGESQYRYAADAGGVVPMGYGRYGLAKNWDLGLMVSGPNVRVEARYEKPAAGRNDALRAHALGSRAVRRLDPRPR